jgi:hypothetical protein
MKQHLKGNIYIDYKAGFVTTYQLLVRDEDSSKAGDEYFSTALTYLTPEAAARGIKKHYGADALVDDVTQAYEAAKREYLIESAKAGKVKSAAMKAKATGQIN